jgi:hypothetical protein
LIDNCRGAIVILNVGFDNNVLYAFPSLGIRLPITFAALANCANFQTQIIKTIIWVRFRRDAIVSFVKLKASTLAHIFHVLEFMPKSLREILINVVADGYFNPVFVDSITTCRGTLALIVAFLTINIHLELTALLRNTILEDLF